MDLASSILRYLVILILSSGSLVVFYELLLGKAKHRKRIIVYLVGKGILWGCGVEIILSVFYGQAAWYLIMRNIGTMLLALCTQVVIYLCFHTTFLKAVMVSWLGDALGIFSTYGGMVIAAFILRRDMSTLLLGDFYIGDILFAFWYVVWVFVIWKFMGKSISRFQKVEFKHKKIWWALMCVCFGYVFFNMLNNSVQTLEQTHRFAFIIMYVVGIPGILVLLFGVYCRKSGLRNEKEFLGIQKRLMQEHVERLVEQEALIKQRQQDTEKQMERLEQLQSEVYQKEEIKEYLEELKEQYKELTVYHYCDDMPLNALLNNKLQKLREEGVNIHVEINNIVFSEEIRKELWIAINEVIEEVENIEKQELMIKIFEMKGQICVQYTVTGRQSKQKIVTM